MILFLGTRPGKTEIRLLGGVSCPYCGQTGTLTVSKTSNWFHIFWIKLFKVSDHTVAECSHCRRAYRKEEFTVPMDRAVDRS